MNRWFYFNILVFAIAIWSVLNSSLFPSISLHILFGFVGLLLILFNWTRHAVFSTIRSSQDRNKKIKLANISKKIMPFHRWIGMTALLFISIHAVLIIHRYGFYWQNLKIVSGLVTGIVLISLVVTGWMRLIKPFGKK